MSNNLTRSLVGIYWDFENLHATIADLQHGDGSYRDHRFESQPEFVQLQPVIDYASSLGDIIINKAYGNWQFFGNYRNALNTAAVDLVQLFPRGMNMKNGADIRLALDVVTDLHSHQHLTHIVIVSCDSDFIPVVQAAKRLGRYVSGVGVSNRSSRFLISAVNEFRYYDVLAKGVQPEVIETPPVTNAAPVDSLATAEPVAEAPIASPEVDVAVTETRAQLAERLRKALTALVERNGSNFVFLGGVKQMILRSDPAFDETLYGYSTFKAFLADFPDVVRIVDYENGGHVSLVEKDEALSRA